MADVWDLNSRGPFGPGIEAYGLLVTLLRCWASTLWELAMTDVVVLAAFCMTVRSYGVAVLAFLADYYCVAATVVFDGLAAFSTFFCGDFIVVLASFARSKMVVERSLRSLSNTLRRLYL